MIKGVYRHDVYKFPEGALRELVTNAVMHRNYAVYGSDIQVALYSVEFCGAIRDRMLKPRRSAFVGDEAIRNWSEMDMGLVKTRRLAPVHLL